MKCSTVAVFAGLMLGSQVCAGQAYPNRPVRLVITYPPGGTTDFVGRQSRLRL